MQVFVPGGLTRRLTAGPVSPGGWEISDDGLTYTFEIRDDAPWSNGDPVKSYDFIYAWQRALLPDTAADYSNLFFADPANVRALQGRRYDRPPFGNR